MAASLLLGTIVLEAALRLGGHTRAYLPAYFQPDPVTGWSPIPNAEGRRQGTSVLTLAEPMRRHGESPRVCLHGFSNRAPGYHHWNERGHAMAGELLAAWTRRW